MQKTKFIWKNGKFEKWDKCKTHVLTHGLHYGSSVFEGVRMYSGAIFRLKEHVERLFYSAKSMGMELDFSPQQIEEAIIETVKKNKLTDGYIRPLVYYGEEKMGLSPVGAPLDMIIACWPWGAYLGADVVKGHISKFMRIHPKSVIHDAKVGGYYANSILATLDAKSAGSDEAILLDFEGNVAEGPGENLFMVKDGQISTPKGGAILEGLTRDTIMQFADVKESTITPEELKEADEVFFVGTAAEVTGLSHIDETQIGDGKLGPETARIKEAYLDIVHGRNETFKHMLTYV